MTRRMVVFGLALAFGLLAAERFPRVEVETLSGKKLTLPDATAGTTTLYVIGFTHGSNEQTKVWTQRAAREIPATSVYTLVELEAAPRLVRPMIRSSVKGSTPKELYDRFVLAYHNEKELKAAAGYTSGDDAWLVLVDRQGQIVWRSHGAPTDAMAAELKRLFAQYSPNGH